jgi:flagellin
MSLPPNSNIDAMLLQSALTNKGQKKSIAIQRLGTGFRINTAKDDSAGLAVSDGTVSQVRALQAQSAAHRQAIDAQLASGPETESYRQALDVMAKLPNPQTAEEKEAYQKAIATLHSLAEGAPAGAGDGAAAPDLAAEAADRRV